MVYASRPFHGEQVIKYFRRYTRKVAISNRRIINADAATVTFSYKSYRDGSTQKQMRLSNQELVPGLLML